MKRKGLLKGLLLMAAGLFALRGWSQRPGQGQDQRGTEVQQGSQVQGRDSFTFKAPLDTIGQAGFYRVILTPEVLAKCNRDLSDIRIGKAGSWQVGTGQVTAGTFVPYVLKTDFPTCHGESFIEFPILPAQKEDSAGDIRIGNWSGGAINSLFLQISPSASGRNWTLSGSNDGQKWFSIREHIQVFLPASDLPYNEIALNFPTSNYHYFKIIQEDKAALPLHIIRAGIITRHAGVQRYRPIPSPVITQKDSSDHHSYITLDFHEPFFVERLDLHIKGPKLYKRTLRVREETADLTSFELDPANTSIDFAIPLKQRSIRLDIENEDNAPLVLDKVEADQKERYLLAWLEPGKYEVLFGDKHALEPKYDLRYFVDTVSQEPPALMPGPVATTGIQSITPIIPSRDYKGVYLWGAIIPVLALLIWLCVNMLRSIGQSRQ